jgi:hypothetical protein
MTERIPVIYNQSANQLQEVILTDEVSVGIFTARMLSNPNIITNELVSIANSYHNYANFGPFTIGAGATVVVGLGVSYSII